MENFALPGPESEALPYSFTNKQEKLCSIFMNICENLPHSLSPALSLNLSLSLHLSIA
jgi:hypothetical protein